MIERWTRIDKGDGQFSVVLLDVVQLAARNYFSDSGEVVASGRFSTPFAIYSREDQLTGEELAARGAR